MKEKEWDEGGGRGGGGQKEKQGKGVKQKEKKIHEKIVNKIGNIYKHVKCCENTKFSGKFKIEIQLDIISQTLSEHFFLIW